MFTQGFNVIYFQDQVTEKPSQPSFDWKIHLKYYSPFEKKLIWFILNYCGTYERLECAHSWMADVPSTSSVCEGERCLWLSHQTQMSQLSLVLPFAVAALAPTPLLSEICYFKEANLTSGPALLLC